jgi:hypothetical protein
MPEIEVGDLAVKAQAELTKADFVAMAEADKVKVLIAEKEAILEQQDMEKAKGAFFTAMKAELAAFDADAKVRLGNFESQLSQERTVIEIKWKDAEALGTYAIPQ